ncbi:MAG: class I SAM-dependent methyltransferase, partial [Amphiplicatus sp.]
MKDSRPDPALRDAFFDLPAAALGEKLKQEKFFHDMELGGGARTGSWVYEENYPPNYHLWPVLQYLCELDLSGKRCLDIGTFDGMTAFVMAELGATRVDATCQYDLDRFRIARAIKKYETVAYHPKTDLESISASFERAQYDLVVISAMLHHLTAPLDALLEARRLVRRDGFFILESIFVDSDAPALFLNTELDDPIYGAPTLFVPTLPALRGMLRFAGFELVSETRLLGGAAARETNHERVTFLARARKPSQVPNRPPKTAEIHSTTVKIGPVEFSALENDPAAASDIRYSGPHGDRALNIWLDRIVAPLQPQAAIKAPKVPTLFSAGRENRFFQLASNGPNDAFDWRDVYLLGARYPGETMPDGMTWGLKQFANLHVLDYVRKLGLARILEVGPGFNFYFTNHL